MIKKILFFIALISTISTILSQAPNKINFQAVVRNSSGGIEANTAVAVSIVISDGTNTYTYAPSINPSTNGFGLLNLVIGPIAGTPSAIDWSSGVTIESSINNVSSGNPIDFRSVPYAIYATQVQNYPISATDGQILQWNANANNGNGEWSAINISNLGITGNKGATGYTGTTGYTGATGEKCNRRNR